MKVVIFGTYPNQFNGYSKVVYEISKVWDAPDLELHIFGFLNMHNHPGHRKDVPAHVVVFDALANESPRAQGFGVNCARDYVARVRPDAVIVFNDLVVLTAILKEVCAAPNRAELKVIPYIDQVYLSQRRDLLAIVNEHADAALAFTPGWRDCIVGQGLPLPCFSLPHGFNPRTYFPVPKHLARRFFGLPKDAFLILNLNRNQPRKRWDICLQAFAEVVVRLPDAPIRLVVGTALTGAWNIPELFERELLKRGVQDAPRVVRERLVVPGHAQMLTDLETNFLYNVADIGINTCDGEGFGLCNFEQAAIGIPQVVPALGGFLHFFDETCALMVKPQISIYVDSARDGVGGEAELSAPKEFADAIIRYYGDRDLMRRHGASSRERILRDFVWADIAATLDGIIREDVGVRHKQPAKSNSNSNSNSNSKTVAVDSSPYGDDRMGRDRDLVSIASLERRILTPQQSAGTCGASESTTRAVPSDNVGAVPSDNVGALPPPLQQLNMLQSLPFATTTWAP
eukprot:gene10945-17059_t